MARSTLELLLDSIKEREEEPPDHLPVLPQRPTSRARLPSRKRTSVLLFADPSLEQPNGHTQHQALHASDTSKDSSPHHSNGKRFDGHSKAPLLLDGLVHEESPQAVQNGHSKEVEYGDVEQMPRSNKESFTGDGKDAKESTLLSQKQETVYTSLKKRRRIHHIQSLQKVFFLSFNPASGKV